jgi:hypothetical protein
LAIIPPVTSAGTAGPVRVDLRVSRLIKKV